MFVFLLCSDDSEYSEEDMSSSWANLSTNVLFFHFFRMTVMNSYDRPNFLEHTVIVIDIIDIPELELDTQFFRAGYWFCPHNCKSDEVWCL